MMSQKGFWDDAVIIDVYTREQALADGVLVDVSEWSGREAILGGGFSIPVAMTRSVWAAVEGIPTRLEGLNDLRGRAHDVIWMALCAARRAKGSSQVGFKVIMPRKGSRKKYLDLVLDIGAGDAGEPVITIGQPSDF